MQVTVTAEDILQRGPCPGGRALLAAIDLPSDGITFEWNEDQRDLLYSILPRFAGWLCQNVLPSLPGSVALRGADLRGADLWGADLRGADLRDADLRDADLQGADLRDADLRDADLQGANLWDADLRGADLRGADLQDTFLRGADLRGATR